MIPLGVFSKKYGYKQFISQDDTKENLEEHEEMAMEEIEEIDM